MSIVWRADACTMWVIDIHRDANGEYRWRLWGADGRPASGSNDGYTARFNAQRHARRFQDEARDLRYEVVAGGAGDFWWQATRDDGTPMARSSTRFATTDEAAKDADRIRRFAGGARVP